MRTVGPGAIKAGEAYVAIGSDLGPLALGLKSAHAMIAGAGMKLIGMGAMMAAPFAAGLKVASDFEAQMAKVSTMLGEQSMHLMPSFEDAVRDMSVAFGESSQTLSDGLYDILSAQIDASQATTVLTEAARAAVAGASDTATATDAIVTLLKTYRIEASQAGDVSDLLFRLVEKGRGTFADFAPAIGMVAATTARAGIPIEELTASFASMTRGGINANVASTALNSTIMAFLKPTSQMQEAAKSVGLTLNSQTLRTIGLRGVIQKLSGATADQVAQIIGNRRALRGLNIILGDTAGFYEDVDDMMHRTGATQRAFEKQSATLAFTMGQLKQGIVDIAREIGNALLPAARDLAVGLKPVLAGIKDWIGDHPKLVAGLALVAFGTLGVGAALMVVALALKIVGFLFSPAGAIGMAILGLAALTDAIGWTDTGFLNFVENIRVGGFKIETWLTGLALHLQNQFDWLWTKIGNGFIAVVGGVQQGIAKIRAFMLDVMAFMGEQFEGLVNGVVTMVNAMIRALNKLPKIDIDEIGLSKDEITAGLRAAADTYNQEASRIGLATAIKIAERNEALAERRQTRQDAAQSVFDDAAMERGESEGQSWLDGLRDKLGSMDFGEMAGMGGAGGGAHAVEVGAYLSQVRGRTGGMPLGKAQGVLERQLGVQEQMRDALLDLVGAEGGLAE